MAKKSSSRRSPVGFLFTLLIAIALLALAHFRPDLLQSLLGDSRQDPQFPALTGPAEQIEGKLSAHFIDVGQGDATLLITPDNKTVLIDCGPNSDQERLLAYLESLSLSRIDMIFFTHPHEDHIGGGDLVIEHFEVGRVFMPDAVSSSSTFEKLLRVMEEHDLEAEIVEPGDVITLSELTMTVYGPITIHKNDANNCSIILRAVYRDTSFLFSGDAEKKEEAEVLERYGSALRSDVYQVGHHGSETSSHPEWVQAIRPRIAVFSCGKDNEYGHPHDEVIQLLSSVGATLYRTDLQGNIVLISDGKSVE